MEYWLNLQQFADEGEGAAIPETAGAETATAAESTDGPVNVSAGDTLADGTAVSSQVAAEMNRQMAKHPELRKTYGQGLKQNAPQGQPAAAPAAAPDEKTIEDEWKELRNGKYKEQYGRDVREAVQDRFRNQADVTAQLNALEPMLKVLRERAGVTTNEDLTNYILDDDSLYEEAANEAGMTVPKYKEFLQMKEELDAAKAREEQSVQEQIMQRHFAMLQQQAEEFRKQLPGFDLMKELQNDPKFVQLTSPEVGLDVQTAFFALHKDEMMPQAMAAGMERAKAQMSQTIQAQRNRPVEGAMKGRGMPAADFNRDPSKLTRNERNKIYDLIHKGLVKWG